MLRVIGRKTEISSGSASPTSCARKPRKSPMRPRSRVRPRQWHRRYHPGARDPRRQPRRTDSDVIDKDVDIAMLVLAERRGGRPGPIITMLAKSAGTFPSITSGARQSNDDLDALS
jgi:hypothetical protein